MEITRKFIEKKYNVLMEKKQIEKQIDTIIFHINSYDLIGTYNSFTDFFTEIREKIEKEYPQIKKASDNLSQFFKIKMYEDYDEIYCECLIFQIRFETENETIDRLIKKEKNLLWRTKKSRLEMEEKIKLFKKLQSELNL